MELKGERHVIRELLGGLPEVSWAEKWLRSCWEGCKIF
jgi:hypothetical protein